VVARRLEPLGDRLLRGAEVVVQLGSVLSNLQQQHAAAHSGCCVSQRQVSVRSGQRALDKQAMYQHVPTPIVGGWERAGLLALQWQETLSLGARMPLTGHPHQTEGCGGRLCRSLQKLQKAQKSRHHPWRASPGDALSGDHCSVGMQAPSSDPIFN
jgi:hypothetical protein